MIRLGMNVLLVERKDMEKEENKREEKIKIGIIKKFSFDEDGIHATVKIDDEDVFAEGPAGSFEEGDYKEGVMVEMCGKDIGTIVGEWEFGDLGILPLFQIEKIKIIR